MRSSPPPTEFVVAVAVPVPGLGLLSYRLSGRTSRPPAGARVVVPLGSRTVIGVVVDAPADAPEGAELRDVSAVLDESEPFLPPDVVARSIHGATVTLMLFCDLSAAV